MNAFLKIIVILVGSLVLLAGIGYLGFQVKPRTSPPFDRPSRDLGSVPLPADLPAPVYRHFEQVVGTDVPVVKSAVVWGAPKVRINGLLMRMRHQTYYAPGQYHRDMNVPWFGLPVITGTERYTGGVAMMNIGGEIAQGEKMNQGACLGAWAEAIVMPSIYVTDPRVRWEAVDDVSAHLIVPCGADEETLTFTFDPDTGLMSGLWAMRYRSEDTGKIRWSIDILAWETVNGVMIPASSTVTWADEGRPWLYWTVDGVLYNVDVSEKIP